MVLYNSVLCKITAQPIGSNALMYNPSSDFLAA